MQINERMSRRHVFKKNWTTCSKFVHHSKLNDQHKLGEHMWPSYGSLSVDLDNS